MQKHGIPVIPNIRWSDESSFDYCFLGVPKGMMVSVSTHGCITSREERRMFKTGVSAMLETIQPEIVLVHGYMPDDIYIKMENVLVVLYCKTLLHMLKYMQEGFYD